ncbi:YncE family protein [Streptomyces massasporeus]|uniref:YncE family protein n=1 Tax=Streptomyces massasporeus TaxID=67324 RepID=UPI0036E4BB6A
MADAGADELLVVDTATLTVSTAVALPGAPHGLAMSTNGGTLAVTIPAAKSLAVIDTTALEAVGDPARRQRPARCRLRPWRASGVRRQPPLTQCRRWICEHAIERLAQIVGPRRVPARAHPASRPRKRAVFVERRPIREASARLRPAGTGSACRAS